MAITAPQRESTRFVRAALVALLLLGGALALPFVLFDGPPTTAQAPPSEDASHQARALPLR